MYTAGTCRAGLLTFYLGPRRVFSLALGEDVPLGGTLVVTTCGVTLNNTVLYVGLGCPKWDLPFQCLAANDNSGDAAGQPACAANQRASTVTITSAPSRSYFLQLGGYGGAAVTAGVQWQYRPPEATSSPTKTSTGTGSRSGSMSPRTRSRSATRSRSGSRSRKPKLV